MDSYMIIVPAELAAHHTRHNGEAGRQWIKALPQLVERLCVEWGLEIEQADPLHGYLGIMVPVMRDQESYMLKVSSLEDTAAAEAALRAWDGNGAVRLFEARPEVGALLLERLDSQRSLHDLDLFDAAEIAGTLVRRLAVPTPAGIRNVRDVAARIAESLPERQKSLNSPVPLSWLKLAGELARELGPHADNRLLHGDLHYGNVLAGEREPWLAVDPDPLAGDPEWAVPELLWTLADKANGDEGLRRLLRLLVDNGEMNAGIARGWAIVRSVDYWLWGLEKGLTWDIARCQRVLEVLV